MRSNLFWKLVLNLKLVASQYTVLFPLSKLNTRACKSFLRTKNDLSYCRTDPILHSLWMSSLSDTWKVVLSLASRKYREEFIRKDCFTSRVKEMCEYHRLVHTSQTRTLATHSPPVVRSHAYLQFIIGPRHFLSIDSFFFCKMEVVWRTERGGGGVGKLRKK